MVQNKDVGTAHSTFFLGKILLPGKEDFPKKCTSKRKNQARQPTFAPDKTKAGAAGMKLENNQVKRIEKEKPGR